MIQQTSEVRDDLLGRAANEFFEAAARGDRPSIEEFARRYPEIAEDVRRVFPALALVGDSTAGAAAAQPRPSHTESNELTQLGDFRILCELGHGGMGTVFEAEQISMGRRVALKVLPFAALANEKSLQRFRNEVRAAAALDHPNIVGVYSVGEERGIHYYSMQLIRGQTLADLIAAMRQGVRGPGPGTGGAEQKNGRAGEQQKSDDNDPTTDYSQSAIQNPQSAILSTLPHARLSTAADTKLSREHYRTAAKLGIQAADALQHAHELGVLHRDIKPGNLMLDVDGKLYVTDFGLARIEADAGLTMTGDLIGTLRYMAPEQALAKRGVIDHRADIYSLGVTLYELLTFEPAFGEIDRSQLLKQIAFEEPKPLRKLDRQIPPELETIVLKSIEKNPDERYQTAAELAADLRAYLEDRPIMARYPTPLQQISKWSRRHVGVVWTLLLSSLVVLAILGVGTVLIAESRNESIQQRQAATQEKQVAVEQRDIALTERNRAHRNLYYAEMPSGQSDWEKGNVSGLRAMLVGHLPVGDEQDVRGWEWYYLMSLCAAEKRTLRVAVNLPYAAWSPDGKYIGTPGMIWDAESGDRVSIYDTSMIQSCRVAWSPDGQKFAWAMVSDENAIYFWDRVSDRIDRFGGHESSVWCVAWSPDGTRVASGSMDNTVKIWDWSTKRVLRTIKAPDHVMSVAWSPDSELLAAGFYWSNVLQIWNPSTGELVKTLAHR